MRRLKGWWPARARGPRRRAEWSGLKYCSPTVRIRRSLRWGRGLVSIIRQCNAVSSGRWPMVPWRHSMTDHDRVRSRQSRPRPGPGWSLWRVTKPSSTAIRTSCGRRGCWHAMRVSMDRRQGTGVWPTWSRVRCARFSAERKLSRTRCATIWNVATPSSSRRWRRFCVSIVRSKFSKGPPPIE